MTDAFLLVLLGAGITLVILAVILYRWWQEHGL